jgi:hypothetical protein
LSDPFHELHRARPGHARAPSQCAGSTLSGLSLAWLGPPAEHSAPAPNAAMHGAQIVRRSNFHVNAASTPLVPSKNRSSNVQLVVLIEAWQLTSPSELADGSQVTCDALCQICLPANRIKPAGLLGRSRAECGKVCYRQYRKTRKWRKQRGRCRANPRIEITEDFTDGRRQDRPRHTQILY